MWRLGRRPLSKTLEWYSTPRPNCAPCCSKPTSGCQLPAAFEECEPPLPTLSEENDVVLVRVDAVDFHAGRSDRHSGHGKAFGTRRPLRQEALQRRGRNVALDHEAVDLRGVARGQGRRHAEAG